MERQQDHSLHVGFAKDWFHAFMLVKRSQPWLDVVRFVYGVVQVPRPSTGLCYMLHVWGCQL